MPENFEKVEQPSGTHFPQESDGGKEEVNVEKAEKERTEFIKGLLGQVFDKHQIGAERIAEIINSVKDILESEKSGLDKEATMKSIQECSSIEDRQQFIDRIFEATKPVADFRRDNPELNIEIMMEAGGFTKINRSLYYGRGEDSIHIHLAPSEDVGIAKVKKLIFEGLLDLAQIVKGDKDVQKITARSWIVGDHSKLIEKLGFTVDQESGEIVDDERGLGKEIKSAEISREDFLKRYLRERYKK